MLINQRRQQQFSEVAPSTYEIIRLQEQLNNSNLGTHIESQSETQSETITVCNTDKVPCLYCSNFYAKRGMTKHVNKQHPHQ